MANQKKKFEITKPKDVVLDKIGIFFKRSTLKSVLKILVSENAMFRTFKSVKNINRLFTNLDLTKYKNNSELLAYVWCICFISKQWLSGINDVELIIAGVKQQPDYDSIKGDIISACQNDPNFITATEAKALFDIIAEALQYGYVFALRDEYINLLEEINLDEPGAYKKVVDRLFLISQSLIDIKHNTNMVTNKVEFNSADIDSVRTAIDGTISALSAGGGILKCGIRRLNTLLSPGFMPGKLYTFLGLPSAGKSLLLLKMALDIRKYNPDYQSRDKGKRPCVLYITMENTFTETIERVWNMNFDEPITNYTPDDALDKLCNELGIHRIMNDTEVVRNEINNTPITLEDMLTGTGDRLQTSNMELIIQYYPYRSINTDDLYTIISDLADENLEVCALVFDYIKRIEPSVPIPDNTRLELDRIVNELKSLSAVLAIPVITAHQMNRAAATIVDTAIKNGKSADTAKLVGRDNVGDSWAVIESSDWAAVLDSQYKPGTDDKYMLINVVKRRRIDSADNEFAKYTYLAHPFAKNNGLRLLDDINLNKVLSLQSLDSDIEPIGKEKANAVPRLQTIIPSEFVDLDD